MFDETPFSSPICKWSLPLIAFKDGEYFPSGTAIIIGQRLAITAKHVIEGFMSSLGSEKDTPNHCNLKFALSAAQMLENGQTAVLWNISKIWHSTLTDIAFLQLDPTVPESLTFQWKLIGMDIRPLKVGTQIYSFGYPSPRISVDDSGKNVNWMHSPSTTTGIITKVYHHKRDSSLLCFPCYETNALFKPSMSGGPVFSDGKLCGLICSGIDFGETDTDSHVGYIVALWPSMATMIDINRDGFPKGVSYPICELAKHGYIRAKGWENVEIEVRPGDEKLTVRYHL